MAESPVIRIRYFAAVAAALGSWIFYNGYVKKIPSFNDTDPPMTLKANLEKNIGLLILFSDLGNDASVAQTLQKAPNKLTSPIYWALNENDTTLGREIRRFLLTGKQVNS
jgi:hypothetical protein